MAVEADKTRGDASPEHEDASTTEGGAHGDAATESDDCDVEEVLEEAVACNADRGTSSESGENEDLDVPKNPLTTRFRYRAAIAHPTPPTTYRRLPLRSRKQSNPTRFVATGVTPVPTCSAGVSAMSTTDHSAMDEAKGSTVTRSELDAAVHMSSCDESKNGGTDATSEAAVSSTPTSYRPPSRSRKQRRPDHFIPDEAEASAHAKARRSSAVLDRFLTSSLRVSPERRPESVRHVTADGGRGQGQPGVHGSEMASGEGPEERGGSTRTLVLAVLGASLVLCAISCVLFYVIGQRTEHARQK